jgi:hypothetical protein
MPNIPTTLSTQANIGTLVQKIEYTTMDINLKLIVNGIVTL